MPFRNLSIRFKLLAILVSTSLLVWLAVILLVHRQAWHEVEEVFDANLALDARVLSSLLRHEVLEERESEQRLSRLRASLDEGLLQTQPRLAAFLRERDSSGKDKIELGDVWGKAAHEYEAKLAVVARHDNGEVLLRSPGSPDFEVKTGGYFDSEQGGKHWRGYALSDPVAGLFIQVGEQIEMRRELVRDIVLNTISPVLIFFPLQVGLVWFGVSRGLRPLVRLTREVERRKPDSLEAVPNRDAPREALPLVDAINRLFGRIKATLENERRFTADAAHELRTPLAALKTHVQVASRNTQDEAMRACLGRIGEGVDRAAHLVDQLLTLARAEARDQSILECRKIDLRAVALEVVASHSQKALDREIDLGLDAPEPIPVNGDAAYLQILLRNLVDNAIRYTHQGGQVTVSAGSTAGVPCLEVIDNGPGVSEEERQRMFARFHRGPSVQTTGSGLGMSIVERIAELHGARIDLGEGIDGRGLRVRVLFPTLGP
ncbi:MAG: hypothetical protein A2286_08880 [Gammaproteobacteria bacterium RIFOXYA12_FULL_61_12]|nr:MAG: hypothetical protein A2514_08290 [Gammaproteobacteria bacterium RIFOXYD12_FULL_61_37]OGT92813.1 MAG: hypothetical protein A2286_08880 [Gammaproteobacteria bacterium RIFOXYA12_FULL_61_12]